MINLLYSLLFASSVLMLLILVVRFRKLISVYYILLFATILISNFGYMQLASAQNVESAIYANQAIYLGASFSSYFFFMCMCDLCHVKLSKYVSIFYIILGIFLFCLTSSVGVIDLYYKSVSLEMIHGVSCLVKEYGPLHILFPLYLLSIVVAGSIVCVKSFKDKNVSHTTSILLITTMALMALTYGVEKGFHIKFELIPIAYLFGQIVFVILLERISLYDISLISASTLVNSKKIGLVVIDNNLKFLGADEAAKKWFKELEEVRIETKLPDNTEFFRQIIEWVTIEEAVDIAHLVSGENFLEATHTVTKHEKNHFVHCIYIKDETELQKYTKLVESFNTELEKNVEEKTEKIREILNDIIFSMANIVENRDLNTGGHIKRTSDVVNIFVKHLIDSGDFDNLDHHYAKRIIKAAPLHDFGKIAIPDSILNKPGKFEPWEYDEMKKHSAKGAVIVEKILQNVEDTFFREVAVNVAHYHHEKYNGTGYPNNLKGEEIPFEARVMALADVFDALVSKRVYKEKFDYDRAFNIIEESSGSHFDPVLTPYFLECRKELENLYDSYEKE